MTSTGIPYFPTRWFLNNTSSSTMCFSDMKVILKFEPITLPPANEVCVKNSVHRGVPGPGGCLVPGGCGDPPRDGYCCGRYASYWNAFLFLKCAPKQTADQKTFDPIFVHSNVYKIIATMTTGNTPNWKQKLSNGSVTSSRILWSHGWIQDFS